MSGSGANRLAQSKAQIDGDTEEQLRERLWNANEEAINIDTIPLKSDQEDL